jgi:hypothetical protein
MMATIGSEWFTASLNWRWADINDARDEPVRLSKIRRKSMEGLFHAAVTDQPKACREPGRAKVFHETSP